jgi:plasmid stability protein
MPKSVQIRDVPDDVHRVLRARAAAAGLSLSEFLRREITLVAEQPTVAEVLARAAARPGGASRQAIVDVIRAARDAGDA